jgi:PGF-pre-PGF domain-containing protein
MSVVRLTGTATADTVTVDYGGNGEYTSIQDAINNASSGDSIVVKPGTYTENLIVDKSVSIVSESGNPDDTIILSESYGVDVIHVTADNVIISGFNITTSSIFYENVPDDDPTIYYSGIFLDRVKGNMIKDNTISYNCIGVYLDCSNDNTLENNKVFSNNAGLLLLSSDRNSLINNKVTSKFNGIYMNMAWDNSFVSNTIYSCSNNGISLSDSPNATITDNNISFCNNGIRVGFGAYNSTFTENTIFSNNCSFYLYFSENLLISDNVISDNNLYGFYMWDSDANTIENNIISNNSESGMFLEHYSDYNLIYNNYLCNINNVQDDSSNKWNISKTEGTNIVGGPYLGGNFWANADGTGVSQIYIDSDKDGICNESYIIQGSNVDSFPLCIYYSSNVTVDCNGKGDFTSIQDAINNVDAGNHILVLPGTYTENLIINKSVTVQSESGHPESVIIKPLDTEDYLILINADNVTLSGFTVTGASSSKGIHLYGSVGCLIENNIVESNKYGIYLNKSDNNEILNNTLLSNNYIGLCLFESNNNSVRHISSVDDFIGFDLVKSCDNILSENTLENDGIYGVYFHEYSHNNSIVNNTISGTYYFEPFGSSVLRSNSMDLTASVENKEFDLYTFESTDQASTVVLSRTSSSIISLSSTPGVYGGIGLFLNKNNTGNVVVNNVIEYSYQHGIYITSSTENTFYNNYLNNTKNYVQIHGGSNVWNVTKTAGTNIVGSSYLGGNFWANPEGTGFSQTHIDSDKDGICDLVYSIREDNSDYLPLYVYDADIPSASIVSILNNSTFVGDAISFYGVGSSPTGSIVAYNWSSDIDGQLNTNSSFITSLLSAGNHTIYFSVQDNDGDWSDKVLSILEIKEISGSNATASNNSTSTVNPTTSSSSSSGSNSGGGGGGGGDTSGEKYENIAFKGVMSEFVRKDVVTSYDFEDESNDIEYVRFTASRNWGKISATIECLHNTSALVDIDPDGTVYRNINVWVGKSGFSDSDNIEDCVIGFKVSSSWLQENGIDRDSIRLMHYTDGTWEELETSLLDENDGYLHFEAKTSGFSPFAIMADKNDEIRDDSETMMSICSVNDEQVYPLENTTESEFKITPGFEGILSGLAILLTGYFMVNRKQR